MRGCPGSGKSTLAKSLVKEGVIHSTDDVIESWGYYNDFIWSPSGLQTKHVELVKDSIGTSSIYHRKAKGIDWKGCDGTGR
jgi:adenylate kinase family enzyme